MGGRSWGAQPATSHQVLDEECVEGMREFFRVAAECGVLPPYNFTVEELASR